MAPKLKHRLQICTPVQTPSGDGSFATSYEVLATVWAGVKARLQTGIQFIRSRNPDDDDIGDTLFTVRNSAVEYLGIGFSSGFSSGCDSIKDINPIKTDYSLFLQSDNDITDTVKGRRYKIIGVDRDDDNKEYIRINAKVMEESGTGGAE